MKHKTIHFLAVASLLIPGLAIAQEQRSEDKTKPIPKTPELVKKIVIPSISLSNTHLDEAIDFLRLRSQELSPDHKGINFIVHTKKGGKEMIKNLHANNISLTTAINAIAQKTGNKVVITDHAVIITDQKITLIKPYDLEDDNDDPFGDSKPKKVFKPGAKRLQQIVIPSVHFSNASFKDCLDFLNLRSTELTPNRQGLNVIGGHIKAHAKVTLKLQNTSLFDVLAYISLLTNTPLKFTEDAIIVSDREIKLADAYHHVSESNDEGDDDPFGNVKYVKKLKPGVARLQQVTIPSIDFSDASLEDCLSFLRLQSKTLSPDQKGFNFIVGNENTDAKISLKLSKASLFNVLRFIAFLSDSDLKFTEDAVFINPRKNKDTMKWGHLSKITLPHIFFSNVSPEDALSYIQAAIKNQAPRIQTNIILGDSISQDIRVNMRLVNAQASTVLEHLARACNASCRHISPTKIVILPKNQKGQKPKSDPSAPSAKRDTSQKNPFLRNGGKKKQAR